VGLPKGSERADVIAYLNSLADNPAPLPKAAENAAPGQKTQ
jgi:cytochrome c